MKVGIPRNHTDESSAPRFTCQGLNKAMGQRCLAWFVSVLVVSLLAPLTTGAKTKAAPQYRHFKSSNATPPILQIEKSGQPLAPGLLVFLLESGEEAALLMTDDGDLVWSGPHMSRHYQYNLQVNQLDGKNVLSRWISVASGPTVSYGQITILDDTYSEIHVICPQFGLFTPGVKTRPRCEADFHEAYFTNRKSVVVTANNITRADLRSVGGPKNGWVVDGQFYEIDIETKRTIFGWSSVQHVPVTKSVNPLMKNGQTPEKAYDYFHINSVQRLEDGNYLVSSRYTSTIFLVGSKGQVIWEFNGQNGGRFGPLPEHAHFGFQHDVRAYYETKDRLLLHFFNDHNGDIGNTSVPSNGLEFRLNTKENSSTLLRRLHDPEEPLVSQSQGSYWPLPNGNVLLDYGYQPVLKEFGPSSNTDVRMTVRISQSSYAENYRGFRQEWHATPAMPPNVAVDVRLGKGWVSWNGATDVTRYVIYAGHSKNNLTKIEEVERQGFETAFYVNSQRYMKGYVQVAAYDEDRFLGKSNLVQVT